MEKFVYFKFNAFLCTRKSGEVHNWIDILVPWMSGLVSGLQNRVRRFESARNLL